MRKDTGAPVRGFCYVTLREVSMTPREWRAKYPPGTYHRRVENGETFYTPKAGDRPRLAAEAYGTIPAGP